MYMQPSFSSKQRRQCRAQRPKKSLDRRHVRGRSRKKRVPQAAGSCSRTRNASPTPSGHVSQHVWYVLRPGISEKQRERKRYSSMRYFQFLFRHRGCASGSAFTCSHELPPSAGPVLTFLGTVPYLPLQTLAIAFEAWTSREKPSSHKRLR